VTTDDRSIVALSRIERGKPLDELAYAHLKHAILTGRLAAGQPVVEAHLVKQLGVSRTPIRKALTQLEQEGFVTSVPGGGCRVAKPTRQDIKEIYQIRAILEAYVARKTVDQMGSKELAEMESAVDSAQQALLQGDNEGFVRANRTFHAVFDRKYGNRRITALLDELEEEVRWILTTVYTASSDKLVASYRDHERILDAVRARDVEAAVGIIEKHLSQWFE
jgi:DNA-binding GntR family transcriptional regulator